MEKSGVTRIKKTLSTFLYLFIFLAIWQLVVTIFHIKEFVLPSPIAVFRHLFVYEIAVKYHWWRHISATLTEVLVSFILTAVLGILMAILITWSKLFNQLLSPIIILFNSLPKIALAPLFLIWFGYGFLPNIMVAFLVAFFPVVINTVAGLKDVDEDLLDLVRYLNASKWDVFLKIRIPNSLPYIFAGLKISATMCVVGSIVGEFIAAEKGLGYLLRDAQAFIDTPTMFACLLLLSAMGITLFNGIGLLEKVSMPWNDHEVQK
jgi:NitT/TauT family transport system permease protein